MWHKDPVSGVVINNDEKSLRHYETMRERIKREKNLQNEMKDVKKELEEMKMLLKTIMKEK